MPDLRLILLRAAFAGLVAATPAQAQPQSTAAIPSVVVLDHVERSTNEGPFESAVLPDMPLFAEPPASTVERRWRATFDAPGERAGLALYLSGAIGHVRIVVNDAALLDTITTPLGPTPRTTQRLRLVDLPPYLLRDRGNRVEITLRGRAVSLSPIAIGAREALIQQRDRKAALMVYAPTVVATIMGCLGLSVLLLWLRRRAETIYALFGISTVAWGLHTAWTVSPRTLLPDPHFGVVWTALYAFVVVTIAAFALRFAGYFWRRVERALLWFALAVPPLLYGASYLHVEDAVSSAVRLVMVAIAFGGLGAVAVAAVRRRSVDSALLVLSGLMAAGLGARDWWVFQFQHDNLPLQLAPFAGLPFVALMAWALIDRFVRTIESVEVLNRELEQRVATKSAELVSALDHMRAARDAAEAADRSKTSFLAAASHDLRQPIHALGLYLGTLRQRQLDAGTREVVDRMDGSLAALDSLFNALLDISRIDAGAVVPAPRVFDLAALLRRLGDEFAAEAASRGLRFVVRVPGNVRANTDPLLLERVLRNLLSNALKYTRDGGVILSARKRGADSASPVWRVEIWDSGPGIAAEEHERVFEEFYQAGNPGRDRRGGLGLGLSIVRRVTRLLNLPLRLHSRRGHGTRFALDLPATDDPLTLTDPTSADALQLAGLAVALIEDDVEVRDAMRRLLLGWGCRVFDGADADAALRQAGGAQPAAIVADLRLADGHDGLQEIERLRAAVGSAVPALVVSGDSAPERVRLMQDSGLPWLAKPVPAGRLRSWLARMVVKDASLR